MNRYSKCANPSAFDSFIAQVLLPETIDAALAAAQLNAGVPLCHQCGAEPEVLIFDGTSLSSNVGIRTAANDPIAVGGVFCDGANVDKVRPRKERLLFPEEVELNLKVALPHVKRSTPPKRNAWSNVHSGRMAQQAAATADHPAVDSDAASAARQWLLLHCPLRAPELHAFLLDCSFYNRPNELPKKVARFLHALCDGVGPLLIHSILPISYCLFAVFSLSMRTGSNPL